MGFLNWLMKGVDVEEKQQVVDIEEEIVQDTPQNNVQSQNVNVNRVGNMPPFENSLDNLKNLSNLEKSSSLNVSIPMSAPQTDYINVTPPRQKSQIVVFKINNMKDLQLAIKHLASKQPCVLNMEALSKREMLKIMDYLNGAVYALSATVHRMQGKLYLVSPEGMEIALQEKKKDKKRRY